MTYKWMGFEPEEGEKINIQAIKLLADPSIVCTVLFAVKTNKDKSQNPIFILSQNFKNPQIFINDFVKLLAEHAKFNQIDADQGEK
jgi:hypothetical protein